MLAGQPTPRIRRGEDPHPQRPAPTEQVESTDELASVMAHEVVHALAPDHKHSGWGILGHAQDERSLLQPQLSIHESAGEALRAGLAEIEQYLGVGEDEESNR